MAIETRTDNLESGRTSDLVCTRPGDGTATIQLTVRDALGALVEVINSPVFRDSAAVRLAAIRWPEYQLLSRGFERRRV